jgi:hypothetical protein
MRTNISRMITALGLLLLVSAVASTTYAQNLRGFRSAGALEFGPDGVLFVGDNVGGAIYAFDIGKGKAPEKPATIEVENIDAVVASALGVTKSAIVINDMAVHPNTREVYLSVTRGVGKESLPALVKVDATGKVHNVRLAEIESTRQALHDVPDGSKQFVPRGLMGPPNAKDIAKAKRPMNILAIMDIEYFNGEIFVSGISNEEFASTLRRISYPFKDKYSSSKVRIFHLAHDQFETRAPIRSMVAKNLGGTDYLIASYTCSPVVLIPIEDLKDGASVTGRTIGDIGNGQPIDMVVYKNMMAEGKEYMFMTNNSRMPQVFPLDGLAEAKVYTLENTKQGFKLDAQGAFPIGPVGSPVMFEGSSLQIDVLNDKFFVSLTRDALTGSLNLQSLSTMIPITLFNVYGEYDFPGADPPNLQGAPRNKK